MAGKRFREPEVIVLSDSDDEQDITVKNLPESAACSEVPDLIVKKDQEIINSDANCEIEHVNYELSSPESSSNVVDSSHESPEAKNLQSSPKITLHAINTEDDCVTVFEKFIATCRRHVDDNVGNMVIDKTYRKFMRLLPKISANGIVISHILESEKKIEDNPDKMYLCIQELANELMSWPRRKSTPSLSSTSSSSSTTTTKLKTIQEHDNNNNNNNDDDDVNSVVSNHLENGDMSPPQNAEENCSTVEEPQPSTSTSTSNGSGASANIHRKSQKAYIKKIEKYLRDISTRIRELETQELSLDDLNEESTYILIDRLKRQYLTYWEKHCKAVGRKSSTGRPLLKPIKYHGSRYPEINTRIMAFLKQIQKNIQKSITQNKKIGTLFPEFMDVYDVIKDVNKSSNLHLTSQQEEITAREVFQDIGKELQKRRREDYTDGFGCFLTDNIDLGDDPAKSDQLLEKTLQDSLKEGTKRLDDIINTYTEKLPQGKEDEPDDSSQSSNLECDERLSTNQEPEKLEIVKEDNVNNERNSVHSVSVNNHSEHSAQQNNHECSNSLSNDVPTMKNSNNSLSADVPILQNPVHATRNGPLVSTNEVNSRNKRKLETSESQKCESPLKRQICIPLPVIPKIELSSFNLYESDDDDVVILD